MNSEHQLAEAISQLALAVRESTAERKHGETMVILNRIAEMEKNLMSAISDFSDKVNASFDELGTAVDGIVTDVQFLKDEIAKLQGTAGQITQEDQALLDGIQARVNVLTEKVKALDAATEEPPTP